MVPYADFGWLPAGFTESAAAAMFGYPFTSDTTTVDRAAASVAAGRTLRLTVSARGACPAAAGSSLGAGGSQGTIMAKPVPVSCGNDGLNQFLETGPELTVNGRPAVYTDNGDGIAWEYAPGAWASLMAGLTVPAMRYTGPPPTGVAKLSGVQAAERLGWALAKVGADGISGLRPGTEHAVLIAIKEGQLAPPSAATRAMLARVAAGVRFGVTKPVYSPFRLSGALPAGWRVTSVSFEASGSTLISSGISAGPADDAAALSVGAWWPANYSCNLTAGKSVPLTRYGVSWVFRIAVEAGGQQVQMICSTGKPALSPTGLPDGLQVSISLDMTGPKAGVMLPGSAELGGPFGVYARMRLLGTDPGGWTARPLG